jgi:putative cofactor-binding repeat protein
VRVELAGMVLAESDRALRVLETSHPPTIYVPPHGVRSELVRPSAARATVCEFKGVARYFDAVVAGRVVEAVAWSYPDPAPGYEALRDHLAFFPGRVDVARIGDEVVKAQVGDFYGGWITSDLVGPFKGAAGTLGW